MTGTRDDTARPDALMVPSHWLSGATALDRARALLSRAAAIVGRKCRYMHTGAGTEFVVPLGLEYRDYTILYPSGHPRQGQPRYEWKDMGSGVQHGYLKPDFEERVE